MTPLLRHYPRVPEPGLGQATREAVGGELSASAKVLAWKLNVLWGSLPNVRSTKSLPASDDVNDDVDEKYQD